MYASAIIKSPFLAMATLLGKRRRALSAAPPSPLKPSTPLPATVNMVRSKAASATEGDTLAVEAVCVDGVGVCVRVATQEGVAVCDAGPFTYMEMKAGVVPGCSTPGVNEPAANTPAVSGAGVVVPPYKIYIPTPIAPVA